MLRDRLHGHECPRCNHVWEHHPMDLKTHEDYIEGHKCQRCGYDGDECRNPIPPPSEMSRFLKEHLGL